MKNKSYSFEIYTKHPVTGQRSWEIEHIESLASNYPLALKEVKEFLNFDVIITDYYRPSFISEDDFIKLWESENE